MIKTIRDARITDVLPRIVRSQAWVRAMAAAVAAVQTKTLDFADESQIYTAIDTTPEDILDILAVSWKIDWYNSTYSIEQKRRVVKSAIVVRRYMGTKYGIETALDAVFPGTTVKEWFDYSGPPFTFMVEANSTGYTFGPAEQKNMLDLIEYHKNLRSHLWRLEIITEPDAPAVLHIGGTMSAVVELAMPQLPDVVPDEVISVFGTMGAIVEGEIPQVPDRLDHVRLPVGGVMSAITEGEIPMIHDDMRPAAATRIGGQLAILTTAELPEL